MPVTTSNRTRAQEWFRPAAWSVVATVLALGVLQAPPASAAPATPNITSPQGANGHTPEITWGSSLTATGYEVQVDGDESFASPELKTSTVNLSHVPLTPLATGPQYVRVRAKNASGEWSGWGSHRFDVSATAGPTPTSPDDGTVLPPATEPPTLTWEPVAGAESYTVESAREDQFVSPTTWTTKATSLVVPVNQTTEVAHFWRVRANLGSNVVSDWSTTNWYSLDRLPAPTSVAPTHRSEVTEVVLEWTPVRGAVKYDLQVDDDKDFQSLADTKTVLSTRYSPATTYVNKQYYWRVRAVDSFGNVSDWSNSQKRHPAPTDVDHDEFARNWRPAPELVHPVKIEEGERVTAHVNDEDLYYQWTPVQLASKYEILVTAPDSKTYSCLTSQTTFTPYASDSGCVPGSQGLVYRWKVRALDGPAASPGIPGIWSDEQRFVYESPDFDFVTPTGAGQVLAVPTVRWNPMPNAVEYSVQIIEGTEAVASIKTRNTSWTPSTLGKDETEGRRFFVRISAQLANGSQTTVQGSGSFTIDPEDPGAVTDANPTGQLQHRVPQLTWLPIEGAAHYRIQIKQKEATAWYASTHSVLTKTQWTFPSATSSDTNYLTPDTYLWYAVGIDDDGATAGSSPVREFTIDPLPPVSGHSLALSGTALDARDSCTRTLLDGPNNWCDQVPATPVLDWKQVPGATFYKVYLSLDSDFTTGLLKNSPVSVGRTRWIRPTALADSEAGSAYYWYVQPCVTELICGTDPRSTVNPARHAFRKTSPQVQLESPEADAPIDTHLLTLRWEDYLATNTASEHAESRQAPTQAAKSYALEISTVPDFKPTNGQMAVHKATVDQTTYTAPSQLFPEGPLYWRVQAVDGDDNRLGWSQTRTVRKKTPAIAGLTPRAGQTGVTSGTPFRWTPTDFAATYELQVAELPPGTYKDPATHNDDNNFTSATTIRSVKSLVRPAFSFGAATNVKLLPPTTNTYAWRVRPHDASGNPGQWSPSTTFAVEPSTPTAVSPLDEEVVGAGSSVLVWGPATGASKYRVVLVNTVTGKSTAITTKATAWATATALTVGQRYTWTVDALDPNGQVLGSSAQRSFLPAGAPTVTQRPVVLGDAALGATLRVQDPEWNVSGVENSYQWMRNGTAISGATAETYDVTPYDVSAQITVRVVGYAERFGSTLTLSDAVVPPPGPAAEALDAARVEGSAVVGGTLRALAPRWSLEDVTTTWQWTRNGKPIDGATSSEYSPVAGDLEADVAMIATGRTLGRSDATSTSRSVRVTEGAAPTLITAPVVIGAPRVGSTLSITVGAWNPAPSSSTFVWLLDGTPIPGADRGTYTVVPGDLGGQLSVRESTVRAGHASNRATSAPVSVVRGSAPVLRTAPRITGTGRVGESLAAVAPTWTTAGTSHTLTWLRDGKAVSTDSAYVPVAGDLGAALQVRYETTVGGHEVTTVVSTAVRVVVGAAPLSTTAPRLSGTSQVGATLQATAPNWSMPGTVSVPEWFRDGVRVSTQDTYDLSADDLGARIVLRYTSRLDGHEETTVSTSSVLVLAGAAPRATAAPRVSGVAVAGNNLVGVAPEWDLGRTTHTVTWLRNGVVLDAATGSSTYLLTRDDAGSSISVRFTSVLRGHASATVTSTAVKVAALADDTSVVPGPKPPAPTPKPSVSASKTTISKPKAVKAKKGKARATVKVTVKATAKGARKPTGTVKIYVKRKVVGTGKLKSSGAVKIKLKSLKVGKHKMTAKYFGNSRTKVSTSKAVTLTIKR